MTDTGTLESILLRRCSIDDDDLERARLEAETKGGRLDSTLEDLQLVSDVDMALSIAEYLGLPPLDLTHFTPDDGYAAAIPTHLKSAHRIMPVAKWGNRLAVVMEDPFDAGALQMVQDATGYDLACYVAPRHQVIEQLARFDHGETVSLENVLEDVDEDDIEVGYDDYEGEVNIDDIVDHVQDEPVIRVVNSILSEGLQRRASDIHIEPMEDELVVRYRIDGILYEAPKPPHQLFWAIISRIKILAKMDITERRLPQDGRFTLKMGGKEADIRVNATPTVNGQKVVMRVLDKTMLKPSISNLGLDTDTHEKLEKAIHNPYGMILITGPTGSGKTTTLYSILRELNEPAVNIVTVEDPVEYRLGRINQIQVKSEIGLTFAAGLRSILRQDPDVVMLGEIRDRETATIAIQAALTGHLVLSTLHTNDAAGAVTRLSEMGIVPFLLTSSLVATQAQRVYRKLCAACKQKKPMPSEFLEKHDIDPDSFKDTIFYQPAGCRKCGQLGYAGREALMEILIVDDDIRRLIINGATAGEIHAEAVAKGMKTMRDVGLDRIRAGGTTIEEILRVTR